MVNLFNYIEKESPVHRLSGASKFALLILWMLAAMLSFNTPFLFFLSLLSLFFFRLSRIRLGEVRFMLIFTLVFLVMNNLLIYLFSPELGVEIYGSRHLLFTIVGRYTVTQEQLLYHFNVILKYTATIPIVILFVATTHPSEFAASLNRLGLNYRIAYGVALALRYIPGLVSDYQAISLSQQARGIEMSKKESLFKRLKAASNIIIPLILSSFDRIEVISNAMELRGFGKHKKRSWYMSRDLVWEDFAAIALGFILLLYTIVWTIWNGGRYWNPFVA